MSKAGIQTKTNKKSINETPINKKEEKKRKKKQAPNYFKCHIRMKLRLNCLKHLRSVILSCVYCMSGLLLQRFHTCSLKVGTPGLFQCENDILVLYTGPERYTCSLHRVWAGVIDRNYVSITWALSGVWPPPPRLFSESQRLTRGPGSDCSSDDVCVLIGIESSEAELCTFDSILFWAEKPGSHRAASTGRTTNISTGCILLGAHAVSSSRIQSMFLH